MWVQTDSKGLVDLNKAYYIGIKTLNNEKKFAVYAAFPFWNEYHQSEEEITIKLFDTKEEAQACIKGINDRIGVGLD